MIGRSLSDLLEKTGHVVWRTSRRPGCTGNRRLVLDLAGEPAQWELPAAPISKAVLCAAETSVDRCRRKSSLSAQVNVQGTVALAGMLVERGAFVAFPSSNLVFDGARPHRREDETVCPCTEYGRQKARAERELSKLGEAVAVVRFTKVLHPHILLLRGWIDALVAGQTIHPFSDMVMAPVTHVFAAEVLRRVLEDRCSGILHVSAACDVSYAQVAQHLARHLRVDMGLVVPVSSRTAGLAPEAVPAHTALDTTRLRSVLGMEPPDVWEAIDAAFGLVEAPA